MSLTVKHPFTSAIADDPTAASAGEVLPSHWNASHTVTGSVDATQMPALTGDVTTVAGAVATTLATVNSNVGTFGDSTHVAQVTLNGKGLVTAASSVAISVSATPGGSNKQFQYNNAGAFGGSAVTTDDIFVSNAGNFANAVAIGQGLGVVTVPNIVAYGSTGSVVINYIFEAAVQNVGVGNSGFLYAWGSQALNGGDAAGLRGSKDTALGRNAAGVVEVNTASAGAFGDIKVRSVQHNGTTVASLPGSPLAGMTAYVTDGTGALAWGATVTGGGSTKYLVWYNGTNWTVAGK